MLSYVVNRSGYSIAIENYDQSKKYFNMNRSGLVMKYQIDPREGVTKMKMDPLSVEKLKFNIMPKG